MKTTMKCGSRGDHGTRNTTSVNDASNTRTTWEGGTGTDLTKLHVDLVKN
jgi:hypothetical protein